MHPTSFLKGAHAFLTPMAVLAALPPELAHVRPAGAPHAIADTVAHMAFWQHWFLDRCEGRGTPLPAHAADGWPDVAGTEWGAIQQSFETGFNRLLSLGQDRERLTQALSPAIEVEMLADYTIHDVLLHLALHNAHHVGQVITLRQQLGSWPPPSGGWTW